MCCKATVTFRMLCNSGTSAVYATFLLNVRKNGKRQKITINPGIVGLGASAKNCKKALKISLWDYTVISKILFWTLSALWEVLCIRLIIINHLTDNWKMTENVIAKNCHSVIFRGNNYYHGIWPNDPEKPVCHRFKLLLMFKRSLEPKLPISRPFFAILYQ